MFICYMQEIKCLDSLQTSLAKVTGATDKQIVVCIGGKRHLLTCDDEVHHEIEKIIPRRVHITFNDDRLVSYKELQQ